MKKLIAATSVGLVLGFAVALANADDTSTTTTKESQTTTQQQPGSSGSDTSGMSGDHSMGSSTSSTTNESTEKQEKQAMNPKTCTDSSGTTYYKGKSGYNQCIKEMKKHESKEQGGTMSTATPGVSGSDTGSMSGTSSGSSSDSNS